MHPRQSHKYSFFILLQSIDYVENIKKTTAYKTLIFLLHMTALKSISIARGTVLETIKVRLSACDCRKYKRVSLYPAYYSHKHVPAFNIASLVAAAADGDQVIFFVFF